MVDNQGMIGNHNKQLDMVLHGAFFLADHNCANNPTSGYVARSGVFLTPHHDRRATSLTRRFLTNLSARRDWDKIAAGFSSVSLRGVSSSVAVSTARLLTGISYLSLLTAQAYRKASGLFTDGVRCRRHRGGIVNAMPFLSSASVVGWLLLTLVNLGGFSGFFVSMSQQRRHRLLNTHITSLSGLVGFLKTKPDSIAYSKRRRVYMPLRKKG